MLNIKKNLSVVSFKLSAFRKLTASNYKLKASRGFTLIELLVVIAIIGILSSIVLGSLNSARNKGADVVVKANLANIKPQVQIYYDDNSHYGTDLYDVGPCNDSVKIATDTVFSDSNIISQISAAQSASGATSLNSCVTVTSDINADAWAVAQQLKSDLTKFWCIDSTGVSTSTTHTADQAGADAAVAGGFCQ